MYCTLFTFSVYLGLFHLIKGQCVTHLTDSVGRFGDNSSQRNGEECTWVINVEEEGQILLTIEDLTGETCEECKCDYIQVSEGNGSRTQVVGTYCPPIVTPVSIIGNHKNITLTYRKFKFPFAANSTQELGIPRGFNASYRLIDACGGEFTNATGTLINPSVDGQYPNNADCLYVLSQPEGVRIIIKIEKLILQEPVESGNCVDYLEFSNMLEDVDLGAYCGEMNLFSIMSASNKMWIRFRTDATEVGSGFMISWERVEDCGGVITDMSGTINSYAYMDTYPLAVDCSFHFIQSEGKRIFLKFTSFDLSSSDSVCTDFVEIKDTNTSETIKSYCGEQDLFSFMSNNHQMVLRFRSDLELDTNRGFQATYEVIDHVTEYGGLQGSFSTPRFIDMYPLNANLTYRFMNLVDSSVFLTFPIFQFPEPEPLCTNDYMEINGIKWCGEREAFQLLIKEGMNDVTFISDLQLSQYGANVTYDYCNISTSGSTSGYFQSPGFLITYPENVFCIYEISNPNSNIVMINFTYVDIPVMGNSCLGYIQIDNGLGDEYMFNDSTNQLCGKYMPFGIELTYEVIRILFQSGTGDNTGDNAHGFHVTFQIFPAEGTTRTTDASTYPLSTEADTPTILLSTDSSVKTSPTVGVSSTTYLSTSVSGNNTNISVSDAVEGFWTVRMIIVFASVGFILLVVIIVGIVAWRVKSSQDNESTVTMRELGHSTPRSVPSSNLAYV